MIQEFFQLKRRPFVSTPAPEHYFPASSVESARTSLVRLVERSEGPGVVIGPVGTGKSLLCQLLAESFRHRFRVVAPRGRLVDRRALLQSILFELGLPYRDLDEAELRLSLIDHVTNRELCPRGILLLVDEADGLSLSLLNELKSLASLTWNDGGCVRLILFGSPALEEKFTHPRLESFNQRIAGRFYLEPFMPDETGRFIEQTFASCGGDPYDVFTPKALQKIHDACGGIPRLVNQLADHALVLTAIGNHKLVDAACVEEAWADLQQLPLPHRRSTPSSDHTEASDVVEFGDLDDVTETSEVDVRPSAEFTLVFHSADNPFGDDFEEEEQVIDHFVSPDAISQRHRRQVAASASERLAEQMFRLRLQAAGSSSGVVGGRTNSHSSGDAIPQTPTNSLPPRATNNETRSRTALSETVLTHSPSDEAGSQYGADGDDEFEILSLGDHSGDGQKSAFVGPYDPPAVPEIPTRLGDDPSASRDCSSPRNYRNLFSQLRRRG